MRLSVLLKVQNESKTVEGENNTHYNGMAKDAVLDIFIPVMILLQRSFNIHAVHESGAALRPYDITEAMQYPIQGLQ